MKSWLTAATLYMLSLAFSLYHLVKGKQLRLRRDTPPLTGGAPMKPLEREQKGSATMTANISKETRREVYRRDGFRCALCDSQDGLQIHHIKPRGKGGADHPMNLITLCWRCHNAAHGGMMVTDYPGATMEGVMEDIELACIEHVADYYAEQGEIWYPWDG